MIRLALASLLLSSVALAQESPTSQPTLADPGLDPVVSDPVVVAPAPAPVTAPATPAGSSSFMDSRLNFSCTHEDVFRDATVLPAAPGFRCGRPNQLGILFFDNYDTRFSGYETLTHLALYKHFDKQQWDVEAGFIVRVNELAEDNIRLSDGGSYIRVGYWFDKERVKKTRVSMVAFPVSSDRMRLGYSYRISWGGSPEFFKANPDVPGSSGRNTDSTPGFKVQVDTEKAYAYAGLKSTLLLDTELNEKRSVLAFMGGAGVDVTDKLRIEANGGIFDRGKNESEDVLGERVYLYGASTQVALHDGMPVGSSIDYALYRNEPESLARLFKKESYPGGLAWMVSAEGTLLFQTLKDPAATGSTRTQQAYAFDTNARVKWNKTRFKLDFMVRDLAYLLHSVPSLPTYWDFPDAYTRTPEVFVAVGVDQFFEPWGLTLGGTLGLDLPATLETPAPADIPGNMTTSTVLVVRNEANRSVLPSGEEAAPIVALKGTARLDFAESFAAIFDVFYQYDPNTVRYDRENPESNFNRATFANFDQLGFTGTLQARF